MAQQWAGGGGRGGQPAYRFRRPRSLRSFVAGRLCDRLLGRCFALHPRSPCPRGSRKTAPVSPRVSNSAPPASRPVDGMGLYDATGARKYLTRSERDAFLTADRVDLAAGLLVFETLKKRRPGVYRSVPVPPARLPRPGAWHPRAPGPPRQRTQPSPLAVVTHDRLACRPRRHAGSRPSPAPTPPSRASATASPPSPPGSPLNLVQKRLGHAQLTTTAIHANAAGTEEKNIARKMWE